MAPEDLQKKVGQVGFLSLNVHKTNCQTDLTMLLAFCCRLSWSCTKSRDQDFDP